jgi:hypothetical protein
MSARAAFVPALVLVTMPLGLAALAACGGKLGTATSECCREAAAYDGGNPGLPDGGMELDAGVPGVTRNGWTWNNVGPAAADIYGIWGSAPNDVWFVGAAGLILHWDGSTFTAADSGTTAELRAVWGSGPNDVWAVGRAYFTEGPAVILRWDGMTWATVESLPSSDLYSVYGTGPSDVWAVGGKGLVVHWDGTGFSQAVTDAMTDLHGVWTQTPGDAWATGPIPSIAYDTGVFHLTGGTWASVPPPSGRIVLSSVWGHASTDLWFAGEEQVDPAAPDLDPSGYVVHWDGSSWGPPEVVSTYDTPVGGIFGSSAGDVHAAGWSVALGWSDGAWSTQNLQGQFDTTWESGPSDVWAAGLGGVMAHWDGAAWTQITPPPRPMGVYSAAAIWADTPSDAWAAGNGPVDAQLAHWNGSTWEPSTISAASPAYLYFVDIWGTGPNDVWGTGSGPDPTGGRIIHWDGTTWSDMFDMPHIYEFAGMWGAAPNDVWFAGGNGVIAHWDGKGITTTTLPTMDGFSVIVGTSANDIWALGGANDALSSIYHWDGSGWTAATVPQTSGFVSGAYAASPNDIWAVGFEGGAVHWDGSSWSVPSTALPEEVGAIWGSGPSDIWAVGWFGAALHYDGSTWTPIGITESDLVGVSGTSANDVWMLSGAGAILHHP